MSLGYQFSIHGGDKFKNISPKKPGVTIKTIDELTERRTERVKSLFNEKTGDLNEFLTDSRLTPRSYSL